MSLVAYVTKVLLVGGFYATVSGYGMYMLFSYIDDWFTGDTDR